MSVNYYKVSVDLITKMHDELNYNPFSEEKVTYKGGFYIKENDPILSCEFVSFLHQVAVQYFKDAAIALKKKNCNFQIKD